MQQIRLGSQALVEFYGCCPSAIDNLDLVRSAMLKAAEVAEATVVAEVFHEFNPQGISGVVVIAESHLAIHSWPEHACAAIDIFTCCPSKDVNAAIDYLREAFKAQRTEIKVVSRGVMSPKYQVKAKSQPLDYR